MQPVIFYQSAVRDPYARYAENPSVYRDDEHQIWGIYSYHHCRFILEHPSVSIPPVDTSGLNEYACKIIHGLARLSNGAAHTINRAVAIELHKPTVSAADVLPGLLPEAGTVEWVDTVCKKLPASIILRSAGFSADDENYIVLHLAALTQLMKGVDTVAQDVYRIVERYYSDEKAIVNFIGLLIQSYDAGRGLLSNILLEDVDPQTSLRFHPPVHNTRRIANEDILLDNHLIKKGDMIMLVLAAANLETDYPMLTFGTGIHACIASRFAIEMATDTLQYLSGRYKAISIPPQELEYEPLINARLLKQLFVSLL